jgi:hypothetical protein
MNIFSVPSGPGGGVGAGEAFGFCAETDNATAATMQAAAKDLNRMRVKAADMRSDYSSGVARSLLDDAQFDALATDAVALQRPFTVSSMIDFLQQSR